MTRRRLVWLAVAGLTVAWLAQPVWAASTLLARHVPVDARVFLEIGDTRELSTSAIGLVLGDVLARLVSQVEPSRPEATNKELSVRRLFADAVGIEDARLADLLLDGRVAIAAEDLSELSAAILLAQPRDPAALGGRLRPATSQPASAAASGVRGYKLGGDYELGFDGQVAVVGRTGSPTGLYTRTLTLLASERGVSLADLAEFQERMAEVPPGCQVTFYLGTNRRLQPSRDASLSWWPLLGASWRSAAVGVLLSEEGVVVEANGRLDAPAKPPTSRDPPVDALLLAPGSAILTWTYPIDYAAQFRRLRAAYPHSSLRFYLDLLQWQMAPGHIEADLLNHLVGDSVLVVGHVAVRPPGTGPHRELLRVPTLAVAVETDDPDQVDTALVHLAGNLVRLVSVSAGPENPVRLAEEPGGPGGGVGGGGGVIRSVPLASLLPAGTARELLASLELSWTIHDRWLLLATHREAVRQMVLARRGEVPLVPAEGVQRAIERVPPPRRLPDMLLVAQPELASDVIDSWLDYLTRHHPEIRQPQWWRQLRRQYWASQVQLGVVPTPGGGDGPPGSVEVAQTLPNWPAHGRLERGDRIIAVDGESLDPNQVFLSLRERLAMRDEEDRVRITVLRAGREQTIEVPMPVDASPAGRLQPFELLQQMSDLLRVFSSASYATWQPARHLVQTRLELRVASFTSEVPSVFRAGTATSP